MFSKALIKERNIIIRYTVIIFIIVGAIFLSITLFIQRSADRVHREEIMLNEQSLINVEKTIISNRINRLISDLLYISDSFQIYSAGEDYGVIEEQWLSFSNRKKIYDQIRFIDIEGDEAIRVNYNADGAVAVEQSELQNKKDRYYFIDTISLNKGQVYISPLDLNIENCIIEQPLKPMIRLATPTYDTDGVLKGIVVLNYSAADMLQQVKTIASTGQGSLFMLNSDGYWIYNSEDSSKEWTFMYEEQMSVSFANEFPDEWETIKSNGSGYLISKNGVFHYTSIMTGDEFASYGGDSLFAPELGDWYIVSYVSLDSQNGAVFSTSVLESIPSVLEKNALVYGLIFVVALILGIFIAISKVERDKVKYFSEYDAMTGIYNRRAGFERLNGLYKNVMRNNCAISICFIDINGLKEVNDVLGHEAGDELIISVVDAIKRGIRENDFVARLGGDEFLIIFEGADVETAEKIWTRIVQNFEEINENENRKYIISVSHGIETFRCSSDEYIDAVINQADEKMYLEKRQIKKEIKIIRQ